MPPQSHRRIPRPALWIAAPTFIVGVAVVLSLQLSHSTIAAMAVGLVGAATVGAFAEARLANIIASIGEIAAGDANAMTNDPMEASWIGFKMWAQAVAQAGTTEPGAVRRALAGRRLRAPSGFDVMLDAQNQHLHKPAVIGRLDAHNVIQPVWVSDGLIAPEPWSPWLSREAGELRKVG